MGKGDKKTVRGKIIMGSYGANRKKKRTPNYVPPVVKEVKKAAPAAKKEEVPVEEVAIEETKIAPVKKAKKPAAKKKVAPKAAEKAAEKPADKPEEKSEE